MNIKQKVNRLTCELKTGEMEESFRKWVLPGYRDFLRKIVLFGALAIILFTLPDYLKIGLSPEFYTSLVVRCFTAALAVGIWFFINKIRTYNRFYLLIVMLDLALTLNALSVIYMTGNHQLINILSEIILIMVYYIYLPQSFISSLSFGALGTFSLLSLHLLYGQMEPSDIESMVMAYLMANMFGILYSRNQNINKRAEFLSHKFENRILKRLEKEIEERMKLQDELLDMVRSDPLTGILNRRAFDEFSQQELFSAERYGHNLHLLMIDIDHFKRVNDQQGHQAGDKLLQEIAVLFLTLTRRSDLVARYGGEEFVMLLSHQTRQQAAEFAEKIRSVVEKHRFTNGTRISVSVGVTDFSGSETINMLVARADVALYQAKKLGRNRVVNAWE